MAIKALNPGSTRDYVSKLDDGDPPTVWKLGVLTSRDVGAIRDSVTSFSFGTDDKGQVSAGEMGTKIERSKMQFEAVRRGLKGWENFLDEKGDAIHFKFKMRDMDGAKKNVVPNELLDQIPLPVIEELSEQIMEEASVSEEDAGNSQGPSSDG